MTVRNRIASTLAANGFGQAVTIVSQLGLTPLFFSIWGSQQYGEWLIISSIPAYLAMADFGIGSAAGNDMSIRAAAGDLAGAQSTFRGALLLGMLAAAIVVLAGIVAGTVGYVYGIPATPSIGRISAGAMMLLFAIGVGASFLGNIVSGGYRCCGSNAIGSILSNISRLTEVIVTALLLVRGASPVVVCGIVLLVKLTLQALQLFLLRRRCEWLFHPPQAADKTLVRRLIQPALGFLAFPLGNAMLLQGPILVLGAVFGGTSVAIFSAMRTIARMPLQVTAALNSSVWPELSLAFGAKDSNLVRKLHRFASGSSFAINAILGVLLAWFGSEISKRWLGSEVAFNHVVFLGLLILTLLSAFWNASAVVLVATNTHMRFGILYMGFTTAGMLLSYLAARVFQIPGFMAAMIVTEIAFIIIAIPMTLKVTGDSLLDFCWQTVGWPFLTAREFMALRKA